MAVNFGGGYRDDPYAEMYADLLKERLKAGKGLQLAAANHKGGGSVIEGVLQGANAALGGFLEGKEERERQAAALAQQNAQAEAARLGMTTSGSGSGSGGVSAPGTRRSAASAGAGSDKGSDPAAPAPSFAAANPQVAPTMTLPPEVASGGADPSLGGSFGLNGPVSVASVTPEAVSPPIMGFGEGAPTDPRGGMQTGVFGLTGAGGAVPGANLASAGVTGPSTGQAMVLPPEAGRAAVVDALAASQAPSSAPAAQMPEGRAAILNAMIPPTGPKMLPGEAGSTDSSAVMPKLDPLPTPSGGSLGELIASGEGGYNSYNRGSAGDAGGKQIDFSKMSVGDVMERQALPKGSADSLFAVGKYQVIPGTMREAVTALGINPNAPFTPDLQERIYRDHLIAGKRPDVKAYITGQSDNQGAASLALAQEFASVADPSTGRSHYAGVGNNAASISSAQAGAALNRERHAYADNIAKGMSPEEAWRSLSSAQGGSPNPSGNGRVQVASNDPSAGFSAAARAAPAPVQVAEGGNAPRSITPQTQNAPQAAQSRSPFGAMPTLNDLIPNFEARRAAIQAGMSNANPLYRGVYIQQAQELSKEIGKAQEHIFSLTKEREMATYNQGEQNRRSDATIGAENMRHGERLGLDREKFGLDKDKAERERKADSWEPLITPDQRRMYGIQPSDTRAYRANPYGKLEVTAGETGAGPISVPKGNTLFDPITRQPIFTANDPEANQKAETELRKEMQQLPSYKNYAQAAPIYQSMRDTADRNTKSSDLNIVYGLGKMMDPTSVVREGEMIMVKNAASLGEWMNGVINQVNGGAALTPELRKQIMTEAHSRMKSYEEQFGRDADQYKTVIANGKLNGLNVLPNFAASELWSPTVQPQTQPTPGQPSIDDLMRERQKRAGGTR